MSRRRPFGSRSSCCCCADRNCHPVVLGCGEERAHFAKMNDKQQNELLEKFINDSLLATEIKVEVTANRKSFKPRYPESEAHYEDCNLLSAILMGAENLMYWLRRNGYTIATKRKKVAKVGRYLNPDGN